MASRVIKCEQGSEEWHKARAGVITASNFKIARQRVNGLDERQRKYVVAILAGTSELEARAIAGYKAAPTSETVKRALDGEKVGELSEAAKNYAFRIAFERISGEPMDEGYETWQMSRGHELEPEARSEHQILEGVIVERAGFVVTEDNVFGASADGLIGAKGGSEYKCFVSPVSLRPVLLLNNIEEVRDQVQGCMWVTGREWWHLGFFCPALRAIDYPLHLLRLQRDDDYIEAMEADLMEFKAEVDAQERALRALPAANLPHFARAA
ncbi:putative phage-type endonuclease [Variovorax sp. PBS-H4]|uniref:lambda exonuclease family protein n=1 Tax=Variovorax sp. PBS-H4 TaxID=434008 RepID=UPI0013182D1D|nr:lambda exonuclease family protein [Variovorax sp. PBS-H4]VTU38451.1 putative phage-type endonuclease [Variovorax sp. PBS-H4]